MKLQELKSGSKLIQTGFQIIVTIAEKSVQQSVSDPGDSGDIHRWNSLINDPMQHS